MYTFRNRLNHARPRNLRNNGAQQPQVRASCVFDRKTRRREENEREVVKSSPRNLQRLGFYASRGFDFFLYRGTCGVAFLRRWSRAASRSRACPFKGASTRAPSAAGKAEGKHGGARATSVPAINRNTSALLPLNPEKLRAARARARGDRFPLTRFRRRVLPYVF